MTHSVADPIELKEKVGQKQKKEKILIVAGPTASGKTALSLSLAQILGGEVVSADSCQVYLGMDIGTAKVSESQRALITHHLIDICPIQKIFNVVMFYEQAERAFRSILSREHVPVVVGGSGFYIHALLYGPPEGPPGNQTIREKLAEQLEQFGVQVLYEQLQMRDPVYAATISEYDQHKIMRALEIILLTDRKVSDFVRPKTELENYDFRCWFIYYPKETLYQRIEKRCDEMIAAGFIDEVKALDQLGLRGNSAASQAIGYRQALEFLDGPQTKKDYLLFVEKFKRASRQYAKRQFTWFRKEPLFRWLNAEQYSEDQLKELILQDFEQND
jgi:tRNA dimethylallyltransferase